MWDQCVWNARDRPTIETSRGHIILEMSNIIPPRGGGGGGVLRIVLKGKAPSRGPKPYRFIYHFFTEKVIVLNKPPMEKLYPFHIATAFLVGAI